MLQKRFDLLEPDIPVAFADGTEVYKELAKTYRTHEKGYYVMAPSGAGKTYFVDNQKQKNWLDGDTLWMATKAHPEGEWWLSPLPVIQEIEQRSDIVTTQAKKLGFWIIGADCYAVTPDAVVVPHWSTHKKYIKLRENKNYDGGATSEHYEQLLRARKRVASFAKKGVPLFRSIEEATAYLAAQ